jgi:hypothetical protein
MSETLTLGGRIRIIPVTDSTWAGEGPLPGSYCLGTENGSVFYCVETAEGTAVKDCGQLAEEAINGIAFLGPYVGLSTRSEVLIYEHTAQGFNRIFSSPGGAHGILALPTGKFFAPAGTDGLFCVDLDAPPDRRYWYDFPPGNSLNFYSLTRLGQRPGNEVLGCAAQTDGLLAIQVAAGQAHNRISGWSVPGMDIIDVCSLNSDEHPLAVAAFAFDRSIVFTRDLLSQEAPAAVRFDKVRGTPYSIRSVQGHIFVLTNREIVVLPGLASRFLRGEHITNPIRYLAHPVEAVDIFVTKAQELLILSDADVTAFSVKALVQGYEEVDATTDPANSAKWEACVTAPEFVSINWQKVAA